MSQNKRIGLIYCQVSMFILGFTYIVIQIWQIKLQNVTLWTSPNSESKVTTLMERNKSSTTTSEITHNGISSALLAAKPKELDQPSELLLSASNVSSLASRNKISFSPSTSYRDTNTFTFTNRETLFPLPSWLQDYQTWHAQQRATLDSNNHWRNSSYYLIMQCLDTDLHCGGTADRLKPVLLCLLIAHRHQRLLLIHWTTPKPLEDFLVPPPGGLDWRLPEALVPLVQERSSTLANNNYYNNNMIVSHSAHLDLLQQQAPNAIIWRFRYQSHDGGEAFYNAIRPKDSPTFAQAYHAAWRLVFTPTRPIAQRIQHHLHQLQLIPGNYSAVHIRAAYNAEDRIGENRLRWRIHNAINCASQLGKAGTPILVTSDSLFAIDVARAYAHKRQEQHRYTRPIVTRIPNNSNTNMTNMIHPEPPLHLEKALHPELRNSSDYYDTFVDLYLMGQSQCVVYTKGGFGYWARLISYNASCGFRYQSAKTQRCRWISSSTASNAFSSVPN